jgi:tetratricopeptide (TPR) repeat protein
VKFIFLLVSLITHSSPALYQEGDNAFRFRADKQKAFEALYWYRKYYKKDPNVETSWRLAMICQFVGMRLVQDENQKIQLFIEGRDSGKVGAALNPRCAACHFWTAINMALLGETVGPMKMLFSLGEVKEHLLLSVKSDPSYAYGGAYRVLGLIEEKLPTLLGGNKKEAKKYYQLAIKSYVSEPLNYLFLARLMKEEFHQEEDAIKIIQEGVKFPEPSEERVESKEARIELQELYKSIKNTNT